ncbi:MAG: hypothetical protein MUF07_07600 [Steroidobacteraceae bacterium]|nr:hypothetical protein [Steroidobacteraceae bacterium]
MLPRPRAGRGAWPATLLLLAGAFAPGDAPAAGRAAPLDAFAESLDGTALDDGDARRGGLRAAEAALRRADPPPADCGATLGAARFAELHAGVARARVALGEREAALPAWRAAGACAPRDPQPRIEAATLLMTLGRFDEARAELARASAFARGAEEEIEELRARLDYATAHWIDAARGAAAVAARFERADAVAPPSSGPRPAGTPAASAPEDTAVEGDGELPTARLAARFWRLLERLARRRAGLPAPPPPGSDPGAPGTPWPAPLWRHLDGRLDERGLVAAIAADEDPRRRREMACEALYYTAQQAFADGRAAAARQRLARVVNLKVVYYVEHDLALAELARLRTP